MRVYLDSNCVIYFVENNPLWWSKVVAQIALIRSTKGEIVVSDLTRAECLVGPFKQGDTALEARYRAFFGDPDIRVAGLTPPVCERAARLRATFPLKLPDALHIGCAIEHGCGLFLSNDAKLAQCTAIPVEILK